MVSLANNVVVVDVVVTVVDTQVPCISPPCRAWIGGRVAACRAIQITVDSKCAISLVWPLFVSGSRSDYLMGSGKCTRRDYRYVD